MLRNSLYLIVLAGFAVIVFILVNDWQPAESLSPVAEHYATNAPVEVGASNLVTAVVVTYRGFDTLGEVTILFLTAAIIGFFLTIVHTGAPVKKGLIRYSGEILSTASKLLIPFMLLMGAYVFINGHLTPGGGFQGGAIVASAFVLLLLANPGSRLNHRIIAIVESVSGVSFVLIGLLGIFFAGGFLDNRILGLGTPGVLLSAGVIPILYIFIGLKVGSELTNIIGHLQQTQNTE